MRKVLLTLTDDQVAALDALDPTNRSRAMRECVDAYFGLKPVSVRRGPQPGQWNGGGWTRRRELADAG